MTTIAYRDGILASDSMMSGGNPAFRFASVNKLVRSPHGDIAGAAGQAGGYPHFLEWVCNGMAGAPPDCNEAAEGIVAKKDGSVFLWAGASTLIKIDVDAVGGYLALGTGERFALGAMWAGADAVAAVKAGIEFDSASGGAVQIMKLGDNA